MIDLPCTHEDLLRGVVQPALLYLPQQMSSASAQVAMVAIAGQESGLKTRLQEPYGPAHSLWQFELGGIHGVMNHPLTQQHAQHVCVALGITPTVKAVYDAMLENDELGACFARLNLWWKPEPIPTTQDAMWAYYVDVWRPGKPDPSRWPPNFQAAVAAVTC